MDGHTNLQHPAEFPLEKHGLGSIPTKAASFHVLTMEFYYLEWPIVWVRNTVALVFSGLFRFYMLEGLLMLSLAFFPIMSLGHINHRIICSNTISNSSKIFSWQERFLVFRKHL